MAANILLPKKNFSFPFRMYQEQKSDPLNTITNAFSKLDPNEGAAVQFVLKPSAPGWQKKLQKAAEKMINPKKHQTDWWNPLSWIGAIFSMLTSGDATLDLKSEAESTGNRVTQIQEEHSKMLDEKATNPGFDCVIRLVGSSTTPARAQRVLDGVRAAFAQFDTIRGNNFHTPLYVNQNQVISNFVRRNPHHGFLRWLTTPRMIAGTAELASFFHLPNTKYNKVETIKWQNFKIAPAPKDIPDDGVYLGVNSYRGEKRKVHIRNEDRFRHFYIIGQTGTGKSSIIQIMARQDLHAGKGLCVIDPHGSLIEDLLPTSRANGRMTSSTSTRPTPNVRWA